MVFFTERTLFVGVARRQHSFVDTDGNRYVGIGTDKFLLIYFEGART